MVIVIKVGLLRFEKLLIFFNCLFYLFIILHILIIEFINIIYLNIGINIDIDVDIIE